MSLVETPAGSSPLARGLLACAGRCDDGAGIIPARAGFTPWRRVVERRRGDHPRSRGVYGQAARVDDVFVGSSPLARGLHKVAVPDGHVGRIIPARAGFTLPVSRSWQTSADHPRSRGVYQVRHPRRPLLPGSSPLARGLLTLRLIRRRLRRIIPARAGFTWSELPDYPPAADHPRSRGVYLSLRHRDHTDGGSSPLARGLLVCFASNDLRHGIIPARAGFTLADPWNPNDGLPYQTAFTFTGDLAPAPPSCGSAVVSRRSTTTPSAA